MENLANISEPAPSHKGGVVGMSVGLLVLGLVAGYLIGKSMSSSDIAVKTVTPITTPLEGTVITFDGVRMTIPSPWTLKSQTKDHLYIDTHAADGTILSLSYDFLPLEKEPSVGVIKQIFIEKDDTLGRRMVFEIGGVGGAYAMYGADLYPLGYVEIVLTTETKNNTPQDQNCEVTGVGCSDPTIDFDLLWKMMQTIDTI